MTFQSVPPVEIGSLSGSSPDETQFIGSSSGIFFANTVRRAFAKSRHHLNRTEGGDDAPDREDQFSVDDCITGPDPPDVPEQSRGKSTRPNNAGATDPVSYSYDSTDHGLGSPPNRELAKDLVMLYFRLWHPLFPFLHGPTFLSQVEAFYAGSDASLDDDSYRSQICRTITFQCVFKIAALDSASTNMSFNSEIHSASSLLSLLGRVVAKNDIQCFQALLAAQLYFIATMSLRAASTVGGLIMRSIFHAGFHRCPFRYQQLTTHDCDIRKRIFWSAYVADRYLSQALGYPLGIQDSDIDVCVPGSVERHKRFSPSGATPKTAILDAEEEVSLHLPRASESELDQDRVSENHPPHEEEDDSPSRLGRTTESARQHQGEEIFASYIAYGRFTGQIVELFHKSIHIRSVDLSKILLLTSDVNSWWNALPPFLQEQSPGDQYSRDPYSSDHGAHNSTIGSYFSIIYQQMILLINRPFLSLDPVTPEFKSSLQTCIGASRSIISTLERISGRQYPSWPGILSGTWMSGLVLAFASALNSYPFKKASIEIQLCLKLLESMTIKSTTASHCHAALKILLDDLRNRYDTYAERTHSRGIPHGSYESWIEPGLFSGEFQPHGKRQKLSDSHSAGQRIAQSASGEEHNATIENLKSNESLELTLGTSFGFEWTQDLIVGSGLEQDIFGNLSWEALFQNDVNGTNFSGG